MKKLEIEKTMPAFITTSFKSWILGGLSFFDFQLFFTNKTSVANKWMSFSSSNSAFERSLTLASVNEAILWLGENPWKAEKKKKSTSYFYCSRLCVNLSNPRENKGAQLHYHLHVQANPKKLYKKGRLFLVSMGETGLCHDIFFKFSLRPFKVIEVKWQ